MESRTGRRHLAHCSSAWSTPTRSPAILLFLVLAVTDSRNDAPVAWMAPFTVGPIVGGLLGAGGYKLLISRFMPADDEAGEIGEVPVGEPRSYSTASASPRQ